MVFKKVLEFLLKYDERCINCGSTDIEPILQKERHYIPLMLERIGRIYAGISSPQYSCLSCNQ